VTGFRCALPVDPFGYLADADAAAELIELFCEIGIAAV
jgi:hypothetical protein